MITRGRPNCSWVDKNGARVFGYFENWEPGNEFAVTRQAHTGHRCRIYKANLTFECG